jgi:hypothetical protein
MRDPDDEGIIDKPGQAFRWQGEAQLAFPDYGGVLHFEPAAAASTPAWLRAQKLEIDFRKGGERLKLAPNRPTRGLKAHYQAPTFRLGARAPADRQQRLRPAVRRRPGHGLPSFREARPGASPCAGSGPE